MKTTPVLPADLRGVFSVPPLARGTDAKRSLDFDANNQIVEHILDGGITRFIYGGNAFIYHVTLAEYEELLEWLSGFADDLWVIPSAGPSYGRAMDQARLLRLFGFPAVMMLPSGDPRDVTGLERGYREFAEAANTRLILYLKDEGNLGADIDAALGAIARLVDDGICIGIKYAIVRREPTLDAYLDELIKRVDRQFVVSGIGERPAVSHLKDWKLPGFTTGSGCIAPRLSQMLFEACRRGEFEAAESLRSRFIPLEDLRDEYSPAKVLHFATELAGIARTGPVPPYVSDLTAEQLERVKPVARELVRATQVRQAGTEAHD
jgi:dihydrodipicolinate synthase/N-acetylneuraminate lyase